MNEYIIKLLSKQFNNFMKVKEKRQGIYQLFAPLYHADGDMMDIFLLESPLSKDMIRVCDYGLTLMRLSYSYEIDTPNKEKILNRILAENGVFNENGNFFNDVKPESLYLAIMQFAQTITKVINMRLFRREIIHSLFTDLLAEFIETKLYMFKPQKQFYPIPGHEEYEVDYCFNDRQRPVYLFGVNNNSNARLATISCQKFISEKISFRSLIVLESLDVLSKKDSSRLMSASDKEFPSLDDFQEFAIQYLEREI